ncbi:hypothetical protein [Paenibacillus xylanivorans]|uniref:hypothetical protein n=1 Tax=Paenibacillus xylanivorans TaxID=1705561 RepID=UPI000A9369BB|nr:hypothetical protein [Paenibacillus xylanivorans]
MVKSTLNFNRELGMTLGITVFGIVQSHVFASELVSFFGNGNGSEHGGGWICAIPAWS